VSERFQLMQQALGVAEIAKDAMSSGDHPRVADKATEKLTRAILKRAKELLPEDPVMQQLDLEGACMDWSGVRSAMQAVSNALSQERSGPVFAASGPDVRVSRRRSFWW